MDVQRRKDVERELLEAKERAEQSNVMKSQFLNLMSHELRTPLTVVLGYLPLLRAPDRMPEAEVIAAMAADMAEAGEHLMQLIDDLLDLSKIEAGQMGVHFERLSLRPLVEGVLGQLKLQAAAKGLQLGADLADIELDGDPVRLRQVLINLVGNAVKFTEEGGVTVRARREGLWLELEVEDSGVGIPEHYLEKVFENFCQVDSSSTRQQRGSGLGLAITRHLVELHGGSIALRSRVGHGSTFTVRLPLRVEATASADACLDPSVSLA